MNLVGTISQLLNGKSWLELLQPFAYHTNVTSAEYTTTIAMVILALQETSLHLNEVNHVKYKFQLFTELIYRCVKELEVLQK